MGLGGGAVICNPVPAAAEIPAHEIRGFIEAAVHAAKARGVSGKAVTPFILARNRGVHGRAQPAH